MRSALQQIRERLEAFIAQRDDVALVLCSPTADALPITTILQGLEENSTSDLFWTFTDAFVEPVSYASGIVAGFATRHEAMCLAMAGEGMIPWPPMPAHVFDASLPPAERLRQLAAFSRELSPIPNAGVQVWSYYPLEVSDYVAYAGLVREIVKHEFPNAWCHHLRFIIREDPAYPVLRTLLAQWPRIQWYQPDLSPEALQRSMEADAADESLSLEERLGNVMVMAGNDFAFHRYPEAMSKYELLLQYYAPMGNHSMAAIALNGMGETYEKLGDLERANASYEAALVPASHGENPPIPVFLNVVLNLANLRLAQQRWAESEGYSDLAQQLATVARNGPAKITALEQRGVCQYQQGRLQDAENSWHTGCVLAAQLEETELCRRLLERLRQLYEVTGKYALERELRQQLTAFGPPGNA